MRSPLTILLDLSGQRSEQVSSEVLMWSSRREGEFVLTTEDIEGDDTIVSVNYGKQRK